ncbi:glycoside hydrolase family 108 protein [Marinobacter changyiensis]|uniref:glycoside hydrolase family 108 protein n=1 Tax=Marinobacter changyiensis TaxID=2604091 RepID=UPI00126447B9|nr:N-acetylmuramidase [Marinobacter changyiensis]
MAGIEEMIDDILRREGGYVDHPADRGGPTNFGITQNTLSRYIGRAALKSEVRNLSEDVARDIYESNYFEGPRIHRLPEEIQPFIFDCAVNHGPRRAIKFVQSVINQAGKEPPLDEDGAMGPNTAKAAAWAQNIMGDYFLKALLEERRNFYRTIVAARPSQEVFLRGWMNRVDEFEQEVA